MSDARSVVTRKDLEGEGAAAGDTETRQGHRPAVLVVDDDASVRELLRRWLELEGYDVRVAADAMAAIAALETEPPKVVVADVHLPGANGLWLAEQIRHGAPTTAIVLATGDATVPPFESLRRGIVAYVLKPFQRDQLVAAVAEGIRWSATEASKMGRGGRPRQLPGS